MVDIHIISRVIFVYRPDHMACNTIIHPISPHVILRSRPFWKRFRVWESSKAHELSRGPLLNITSNNNRTCLTRMFNIDMGPRGQPAGAPSGEGEDAEGVSLPSVAAMVYRGASRRDGAASSTRRNLEKTYG